MQLTFHKGKTATRQRHMGRSARGGPMRRRSSWPIPCQAASSYADSAGQELLSMLRPHADAASTSWEAREDLGQGSNFESFLPVRSRLAPTHRWLVAIGQERVQERLCKGPSSVEHWVGAHESCWRAVRSLSIVTTAFHYASLREDPPLTRCPTRRGLRAESPAGRTSSPTSTCGGAS